MRLTALGVRVILNIIGMRMNGRIAKSESYNDARPDDMTAGRLGRRVNPLRLSILRTIG